MATPKEHHRYLTLPEVAVRIGLGKTRRRRRKIDTVPMTDDERAARSVRRLIRSGALMAVMDGSRYLVREDWLRDYEDRREAAAIRRRRELGAAEWPASNRLAENAADAPAIEEGES